MNPTVHERLQKLHEFQIGDLRKARDAGANFLVAVGCVNATEFVGGIIDGSLGQRGKERSRFESGVVLLGPMYEQRQAGELWRLRCSLVHAYLADPGLGYERVEIGNDPRYPFAFPPTEDPRLFVLNVWQWVEDLNSVWFKVSDALDDRATAVKAAQALKRIPLLT